MEKIGFIGMGNMAQALCQGFINSGLVNKENILAYAPHFEKLKANAQKIGFIPVEKFSDLLDKADTFIMACKPYQIEDVLKEAGDKLKSKAIVSVAAGWDFARYSNYLTESTRLQFVMPNTPAMAREGVFLFEKIHTLDKEERVEIMEMFSRIGTIIELPSSLMGIGGAITGCGPAFVDLFIEAYADAAVKYGISRQDAYTLVSQMVLGSAKLQLTTGKQPGQLKDEVCSPGGTTIRGVCALEENGFRNACVKSIDAIMNMKKN